MREGDAAGHFGGGDWRIRRSRAGGTSGWWWVLGGGGVVRAEWCRSWMIPEA